MPLTSTLSVKVDASLSTVLDLATASSPLSKTYRVPLATGTLAGQADRMFHDTRTLAASSNEDIDLNGILIDALGGTANFVRVKALVVAAATANTNNVIVGGAATNGFVSWVGAATHTVTVRPGGVLALFAGAADVAGYGVTAATADLLRIANSGAGTTVTYDLIVIGTSA